LIKSKKSKLLRNFSNAQILAQFMTALALITISLFFTPNVTAQTIAKTANLSAQENAWIAKNPVVTATNNMDLVPLDFVRDGKPMGFAIDYLNLVAENVGLKIEYQNDQSWNELVEKVRQQEIDITHSLMQNANRDDFLNFTQPYLEIPIVNFGRKGSARINSPADLNGRKIGVIKGWAITDYYRKEYPDFHLVEYTTIKNALEGLSSSEVDVVTGSLFTLEYFISQNFMNNLEVVGNDVAFSTDNKVDHSIASRKDLPILRDILQKGMDAVTPEQYKAIAEKWKTNYKPEVKINFTDEELKWISDHPVLTATSKAEMGPIDFTQGGVPTGYSIDFLNLVARKIGFKVEYMSGLTWKKSLEQLRDKKIDISHSLVSSPERAKFLDFTKPYLNLPWVYYGQTGAAQINSLEDLEGKRIGAVEGSIPWEIYTANYPNLNIVTYKSSGDALNDLSTGNIDIYANLLPVTNFRIKRNMVNGVEVIGKKFFPETVGQGRMRLAVRNDWPILTDILEKGIDSITEEELSKISSKWYTQIYDDINIGLTEEERTWLAANKVVRVSVNLDDAAPFEIIDETGNLTGISGELLELVGDLLNIEFELVKNSYWGIGLEQIENKESAIIPTIVNTSDRQKDILFTDSYHSQPSAIFALKDAIAFNHMESLFGHKIVQLKNDAITDFIRSTYPEIEIVEVETLSQAIQMVSSKRADAYVGVLSRTLHHLNAKNITNVSVVGETPYSADLSMGINPDMPLLASAVSKALNSIPAEEKERIAQKWMAVQVVPKTDYTLLLQIALIATLIIGVIIYWNRKLRGEIKSRIETENNLKIEQAKTQEALDSNNEQMIELQFQRETIERSAEAQATLMDDLEIMSFNMQQKNNLLTEIMNNTGHGIVVFSKDLKLQAWNDTFKEIMGTEDREYEEGMDLKTFFELNQVDKISYDMSIDDYILELQNRIDNRAECNEKSWDRNRPNGIVINTVQRIMDDGTIINTYKDVTLERHEERRIKEMALCDGLTGLANRRAFDVNMEQSIENHTHQDVPFLLAYMDLDNFKSLNDTQGHNAGDLVLIHVADIIKKHIREEDVPARLGGDEFAIIFRNTDDIEATANRLEQIIQEIKNTKMLENYEINVGASAGLTQCLDDCFSASEMVEIADKALYSAKENGKGQVYTTL